MRLWVRYVLVPLFVTLIIDQLTKWWVLSRQMTFAGSFILIQPTRNDGMFLGAEMSDIQRLTVAALGVFLLFLLFAIQYLLPLKSTRLRLGLSLFVGGLGGNVLDRLKQGYVDDFLLLKIGELHTGVFNGADVIQIVGVALTLMALIQDGQILWPVHERRGRKWIHPSFQGRFIAVFVGAGLFVSAVAGTFFYSFLHLIGQKGNLLAGGSISFVWIYLILVAIFLLFLGVWGLELSHRIVGPVFAFERFLEQLMQGEPVHFSLRAGDEFQTYENMASRLESFLHTNTSIPRPPLHPGLTAAQFVAPRYKGGEVDLKSYLGRKVWICLYRYATCPLCASHLAEVVERYGELSAQNLQVLGVFESDSSQFSKSDAGTTCLLLERVPFPLIPDPRRLIYRHYRSQVHILAIFHPMVLFRLIQSWRQGFKQRSVDGSWGRIPAHILIDERGKIWHAHYGQHIADHIPWTKIEEFLKTAPTARPAKN